MGSNVKTKDMYVPVCIYSAKRIFEQGCWFRAEGCGGIVVQGMGTGQSRVEHVVRWRGARKVRMYVTPCPWNESTQELTVLALVPTYVQ